jgi:hypothetical protein
MMSSNYEWHKQQTGERIQARLREAEAHRQAREGKERHPVTLPLQLAIFAGLIVALWFLAGCTPLTEPTSEENGPAAGVVTAGVASAAAQPGMGWTMAERIAFQDRRDQGLALDAAAGEVSEPPAGWSMAERLRFQDRMYESGAYR